MLLCEPFLRPEGRAFPHGPNLSRRVIGRSHLLTFRSQFRATNGLIGRDRLRLAWGFQALFHICPALAARSGILWDVFQVLLSRFGKLWAELG